MLSSELSRCTAYYGHGIFLLAARNFYLDRSKKPYFRLSATFLMSCDAPFIFELANGTYVRTKAVLIAPNQKRSRIDARGCNLLIIDIAIDSPAFRRIHSVFEPKSIIIPDYDCLNLQSIDFDHLHNGLATHPEIARLIDAMTAKIAPSVSEPQQSDARVDKVINYIEKSAWQDCTLEQLADLVHLSPSRLRHLFAEKMGCSITHYIRWKSIWKAVDKWHPHMTITELTLGSDFYDLSHFNRAFLEVFGINPSEVVNNPSVSLFKI